ncbi:MAG TPA: hypothetical protein PLD20_17715 [Blastocatellia bacterium]|nr:hypothetical protein [Blastocatellia bacterium]HMV84804.1 hypothetical protein [Blastocatellia bacterium]HMX28241.1 hypothetical protein [Blastocatellia bacterium]HMY70671.1 hypothetical protein [Blastocatellia bacterium]HMZ19778.1 hypothetical protein [Blastocatellia bacterium]
MQKPTGRMIVQSVTGKGEEREVKIHDKASNKRLITQGEMTAISGIGNDACDKWRG